MYQYIKGTLTEIQSNYVTLETAGIGYLIVAANPYHFEKYLNQETRIYVEQIVREDSLTLYGFSSISEKEMFQSLLKVTGIGPKSALAILATSTPSEVVNAIENEDQKYLQKFPGIGKKTSQQIILDLKGKLKADFKAEVKLQQSTRSNDVIVEEALETLKALGYSKRELKSLEKYLSKQELTTVEDAVKLSLRHIVE